MIEDIKVFLNLQEQNEMEGIERKKNMKFTDMKLTQEFCKTGNLMAHLRLTFGKMIASNTHNLAYLLMVYSMFSNAGLLSALYPIMVFGVCMMEETRPRRRIWNFLIYY